MEKTVYKFTLYEDREVETPEESTNEAGEKVVVKRKTKQKVGQDYAFLRPNKAQKNQIDLFNKKQFNLAVREGLLTIAALQKNLDNDDGILNKHEIAERDELAKELVNIQKRLNELKDKEPENKPEIDELDAKIRKIFNRIQELNTKEINLYNNTAEGYAKQNSIYYLLTQFAAIKKNDAFVPFFTGANHDERLESLNVVDEISEGIEYEALKIFLIVANAYWNDDKLKQEELDEYLRKIELIK